MKFLGVVVIAAGLLLPDHVSARVITFEFTGRVTEIHDRALVPNLLIGAAFAGILSFDSDAAGQSIDCLGWQQKGKRYLFGSPYAMTIAIEALTFLLTLDEIRICNDFNPIIGPTGSPRDQIHASAGNAENEWASIGLIQENTRQLNSGNVIEALYPTLLSSDALPVSDLNLALVTEFPMFSFSTSGLSFDGNLETFTLVSVRALTKGMSTEKGKVTCRNLTTRKSVKIRIDEGVMDWDCEQAGLIVNEGDRIRITTTVDGRAD